MITTLAVFAVLAGLGVYLALRVVRAFRRGAGGATRSRDETSLQRQVDALESDVRELHVAQRFVEDLVVKRSSASAVGEGHEKNKGPA